MNWNFTSYGFKELFVLKYNHYVREQAACGAVHGLMDLQQLY